jgi:hypothetical protein
LLLLLLPAVCHAQGALQYGSVRAFNRETISQEQQDRINRDLRENGPRVVGIPPDNKPHKIYPAPGRKLTPEQRKHNLWFDKHYKMTAQGPVLKKAPVAAWANKPAKKAKSADELPSP